MFRVDPKTVTRWVKAGKLTSIRTLGGHRRYRETEVRALVQLEHDQATVSIADLPGRDGHRWRTDVSPLSDTQRVEADDSAWAPGELAPPCRVRRDVREHMEHGHPGLRGDLPPEGGLPARSAATVVARAFAAYADGDWETCDRLMARGWAAWGEAFAEFVAYAISPAFSYRPADPAWDAFRARLAIAVLPPGLQESAHRPGRHRRSGVHCARQGVHRSR